MNAELRTDRLVADLKCVARDAEDLMKATAGELNEKAREARERLSEALAAARDACERMEDKAMAGMKATDRTIRDHPYQSIGIAFGVGLLLGIVFTKK